MALFSGLLLESLIMPQKHNLIFLLLVLLAGLQTSIHGEDVVSPQRAAALLKQSVQFYRQHVSIEGGYLWRYSADLSRREGEGKASPTTAWVQPPGTPSVGSALLTAYRNTRDREYLEAARETAHALLRGQLQSGGWDYRIEFSRESRARYYYRADGDSAGSRNVTTLDDNTTQSALGFLMHLDRQLGQNDKRIHEGVQYALESLLKAQYPNGAWPQRYSQFPRPADFPVHKANYPESWPREYPAEDYRNYYTFNDNSIADTISRMLDAAEIYQQPRYRDAALKAGDFIILAQMPDPQPAWSQQYNNLCQPAWARKFEPPSITGGESQGVLFTLLELYRRTGEERFLEPVPRALKYLEASRLDDGQLARFYELKTNRPLFFTRTYELVYHDRDLPTHYGFKVGSRLKQIRTRYQQLLADGPDEEPADYREWNDVPYSSRLARAATEVVHAMDKRGAWVEEAGLRYQGDDDSTRHVIQMQTYIRNLEILSRYVGAAGDGG